MKSLERKLNKSRIVSESRAIEITRLTARLSGFDFEFRELKAEKDNLAQTIATRAGIDLQKARMDVERDHELTDKDKKIRELEAKVNEKNEQLKWGVDDYNQLAGENEKLKEELKDQQKKRTTSEELMNANEKISSLEESVEWHADQLVTFTNERNELLSKLESQLAQSSNVQSVLSFRNAEYDRLEIALQDTQKAIEDYETKLGKERHRAETAERERDEAKTDVAAQKRLVQNASVDSTGIRENLTVCQSQLDSARSKIANLEKSLEAAKRDYENVVDEKAAIMTEISKLRADNSAFNMDPARFIGVNEDVYSGEEDESDRSESPSKEHGIQGYNSSYSDSSDENLSSSGNDTRSKQEAKEKVHISATEDAALNAHEGQLDGNPEIPGITRYVERIILVDLHSKNALKCWFSTEIDMIWLILQALWLVKLYDFLFTAALATAEVDVSTSLGGPRATEDSDGEVTEENNRRNTNDAEAQNITKPELQIPKAANPDTYEFSLTDLQATQSPSTLSQSPEFVTEAADREKTRACIPYPTSQPNDLQLLKHRRTPGDPTSPFTGRVPSIKWTIINFFLHLIVYMYIFSSYVERSLWLAANEETRAFYVDWFTPQGDRGYMQYPFHDSVFHLEPWFTRSDIWVYKHIVEPFWTFFEHDGIYVLPG